MAFDEAFFNIGRLDRLSYQDTFIHRLDPRVKVLTTMFFAMTVISFSKYEVISLVPFLMYPVLLLTLGDLPAGYILRKLLFVSPFALFVGIFNPLLDSRPAVMLFGFTLSAGWLSFASIMIKFVLTVGTAIILIATTSFPGVCQALRRLGAPALFVSQLLFLYRYLFVLLEETMRIVRARDMRSFGARGLGTGVAVRIIGNLFIRTMERAERIYRAMLSRGYEGTVPVMRRSGIGKGDASFLLITIVYFTVFRLFPFGEWAERIGGDLVK